MGKLRNKGGLLVDNNFDSGLLPGAENIKKTAILVLDNTRVYLDIANTEGARIKGLSDRGELSYYQGMIFVFPVDGIYGFWMKDMKFPLDIIWIDKDYRIVHIENNISPDTYPNSYIPERKSRYVIELHSGFAKAHNFVVGQSLFIENLN